MSGYSGTPLWKKLGLKANHRVALLGAPSDFELKLGALPEGVTFTRKLAPGPFDVMVFFADNLDRPAEIFPKAVDCLDQAGGLWVAWPKRASGVPTDLTEDVVREVGLASGVVDNKVCAIDDTWSGLRFVFRLRDRKK